ADLLADPEPREVAVDPVGLELQAEEAVDAAEVPAGGRRAARVELAWRGLGAADLEVVVGVEAAERVRPGAAVLHQVVQEPVVLRGPDQPGAVDDVAGGDVGDRAVVAPHPGDDRLAVLAHDDVLDLADVLAVEALREPAVDLL